MRLLVLIFVTLSLILCLFTTTKKNSYENIQDEFNSDLFIKSSQNSSGICYNLSYRYLCYLSISSLIFLSISFILLILSWCRSKDRCLAYLTILFLLISSLLIILTYIFYPREKFDNKRDDSIHLMLISSLLTFLSMILTILITQNI